MQIGAFNPIDVHGLSWKVNNLAGSSGGTSGTDRSAGSATVSEVVLTIKADSLDIVDLALSALAGAFGTSNATVSLNGGTVLQLDSVTVTGFSSFPLGDSDDPSLAQVAMSPGQVTLFTKSKSLLGYDVTTGKGTSFCDPTLHFADIGALSAAILAPDVTQISGYEFSSNRQVAEFSQVSQPSVAFSIRSVFGEDSPCLLSAVLSSPILPTLLLETLVVLSGDSRPRVTKELLLENVVLTSFELFAGGGSIGQVVTFAFQRVTFTQREVDDFGTETENVEGYDLLSQTRF